MDKKLDNGGDKVTMKRWTNCVFTTRSNPSKSIKYLEVTLNTMQNFTIALGILLKVTTVLTCVLLTVLPSMPHVTA